MDNWIDVFKVGNHTDSSGSSKQWSEADLNTIVEKYNNQPDEKKHRAPAIVGEHQSDTSLASYGWVKALKVEDGHLYAQFEQLDEDFKTMVNDGRFGTVSIGLYSDLLLQHVAFLGAKPPAIKGLEPPQFSRKDTNITILSYPIKKQNINFSESSTMQEKIKIVVDFLREKYGVEMANDALAKMTEVFGATDKPKEDTSNDKQPNFSESPEYQAYQADKIRLDNIEKELQAEKDKAYFSEMARKAILLPRQQVAAKAVLQAVRESNSTFQFSEGGPVLSGELAFKEFVASFPPAVMFGEFASMDNQVDFDNNDQSELDTLIKERNKKWSKK